MADKEWLPIEEAVELLVNKRMGDFDEYVEIYSFVWRILANYLQNGSLASRAERDGTFRLVFESYTETVEYDLLEDGQIPALFWFHFFEAQSLGSQSLASLHSTSTAQASSGSFWFEQNQNLKDNGKLIGVANGVEVERSSLPGNPPGPRGRRMGHQYDDSEIVLRARSMLANDVPLKMVLRELAPSMEGGGEIDSKKRRLRERLREAENTEKK